MQCLGYGTYLGQDCYKMEQCFKKILWFICATGRVKISGHEGLERLRKELLHQDLLLPKEELLLSQTFH